jgi:hypothetical protein
VGNFFLPSSFVGSEKKLPFDPRMKKEKGRRKKERPDFTGFLFRTVFT